MTLELYFTFVDPLLNWTQSNIRSGRERNSQQDIKARTGAIASKTNLVIVNCPSSNVSILFAFHKHNSSSSSTKELHGCTFFPL